MVDFHDISACPPAGLPADPTDIRAMLTVLVEAERCAVHGYTHICNMTAGKGPSGHFMRRGETSPFVGKFMR